VGGKSPHHDGALALYAILTIRYTDYALY
jgi:hypothetical protein